MKFRELPLKGAYLIQLEPKHDDRGSFARTFCVNEFAALGLTTQFVQCSTAVNVSKGLIRGMHYQAAPYQETKLIRCIRGKIFDVIVDLREDSPTYRQGFGVELSPSNQNMLYVPKDFAHGYQVLEDLSEVFYMMDTFYVPGSAREISPKSPDLQLPEWPLL